MIAHAVIGSNYGDEGKGLLTDYLTRKTGSTLVARCNGGAQAGHTVVAGSARHVFGHIGAGTFAGAHTYLASEFCVNPLVLTQEEEALAAAGASPSIFASPQCRVTTLFDMVINSIVETARGNDRHGSCGMGINETVTRHQAGFFLTLDDVLSGQRYLEDKLQEIKEHWVPHRLAELGVNLDDDRASWKPYSDQLSVTPRALAWSMRQGAAAIKLADPKRLLDPKAPVVIEGAQGLGLDEQHGIFPHVTRSITGVASSILAAKEMGRFQVAPVYVTRAYLTRHGAGSLENEGEPICDNTLHDETNMPNTWQGAIRYAPLNLDALHTRLAKDFHRGKVIASVAGCKLLDPVIALTCVDQVGEKVSIVQNGKGRTILATTLPKVISEHIGVEVKYVSTGPAAVDVMEM